MGRVGGGWELVGFFVPMKFPMSSQCVPQYIHNGTSPSPICFTRHCPLRTYIGGQNIETYAFQCLACFLKHRHDPCEKAISPYLGLGFSASFAYFWVHIQLSSQPEFPAKAEPIAILSYSYQRRMALHEPRGAPHCFLFTREISPICF